MTSTRSLHPELTRRQRRELFERGIRLFNRQDFYDCHEVFEEIWRSTTPEPKNLFQGLIQVAVGFFHLLERKRPDVAVRVLGKGRRRLESLPDVCHGLDLARFLAEVREWEEILAQVEPASCRAFKVSPETSKALPRIVVLSFLDLA